MIKSLIFREDCWDKFVNKNDFSDQECIKVTISKCVGLAIVAGSGILKVPQILKIVGNASVEGLAPISTYIETMIFMQTAGQAITQGIPFTVYGESLIIMVQNFIIIQLIWNFNKTVGFVEKILVSVFFMAYGYTIF